MRYDTTLKEILQAGAPRLWELLLGEQPREFLTVELPSVKMRKPDFVVWLESGALAHLEIQGDNLDDMGRDGMARVGILSISQSPV